MNVLGYRLMGTGRIPEATAVLSLNAESHQESFTVYESLTEAYMDAGENERAIEPYRTSLEINPANPNATAMNARIRGR